MSYNPGLLFYKHYYEGIQFGNKDPRVERDNDKKFQSRNKVLLATRFPANNLPAIGTAGQSLPHQLGFPLTTTYPGLILGTGYAHGSGLMGEFKTGFYFDHTTGLPVIPGSTVKGLLRSAFPALYYEQAEKAKNDAETAYFWQKLGDNRTRFIESVLQALGFDLDGAPNAVLRLEREIFEGLHGTDREKHEDHFAMRDRDIFFDAIITGSVDGHIFSDEYITPHKKPLKNPIPIQILKVRPGVTFQFQFNLKPSYQFQRSDSAIPRLLTPAQRLELFRQILMFMGAGAKTNTGFGHFIADRQVDLNGGATVSAEESVAERVPGTPGSDKDSSIHATPLNRVKKGQTVYGKVIKREGNQLFFELLVQDYAKPAQCVYNADKIQVGDQVKLTVRNVEGKGEKLSIVVADPVLVS